MFRKTYLKILLLIFGLIAAFFIGEAIFRAKGSRNEAKFLKEKLKYLNRYNERKVINISRYDEDLGWSLRPGADDTMITSDFAVRYTVNSQGIRDQEHGYQKKKGTYRIVAMGDSFTFGEGINFGKRYSEIIEQALNNVEVINMGVQGYGMDQALVLLEIEGFKYNPDLVVLFLNDVQIRRCASPFREAALSSYFRLDPSGEKLIFEKVPLVDKLSENHKLVLSGVKYNNLQRGKKKKKENISSLENKPKEIFEKSVLFQYLKYQIFKTKAEIELKKRDRLFWKQIGRNIAASDSVDRPSKEESEKIPRLILERYVKDCHDHNARFLVVNIDAKKNDFIEQYCNKSRITYLDLSGELIEASRIRSLHFNIDPHYNEFANEVIGKRVAGYLSNKFLFESNKNFVRGFSRKE